MDEGLSKLRDLIRMGIRLVSQEWELLSERHAPGDGKEEIADVVSFTAKSKSSGKTYLLVIFEKSQ